MTYIRSRVPPSFHEGGSSYSECRFVGVLPLYDTPLPFSTAILHRLDRYAMKKPIFALFTLFLLILFSACGGGEYEAAMGDSETEFPDNHDQGGIVDEESQKNIVGIAAGSADHTTLVAAVKAADLVGVLSNTGPLTVFAPTNAAFDKLPDGTLDDLLKPENKTKLYNIVLSHGAAGKYKMKDLKDGMQLAQATGHKVSVEVKDDGTYVNGTKILATIDASNGIVHVVDDVFLVAAN